MDESEGNSTDRLFISAAVLTGALTLVCTFVAWGLEASLTKTVQDECLAKPDRVIALCIDLGNEARISFLFYLCPFLPGMIAFWAKWVWNLNFPSNPGIFRTRTFRIVEGLISLVSALFVLAVFRAIAVESKVSEIGSLKILISTIALTGSTWIISKLLMRDPSQRSFVWSRRIFRLAILSPIIAVLIGIGRVLKESGAI